MRDAHLHVESVSSGAAAPILVDRLSISTDEGVTVTLIVVLVKPGADSVTTAVALTFSMP